jgi:hypothetical protein
MLRASISMLRASILMLRVSNSTPIRMFIAQFIKTHSTPSESHLFGHGTCYKHATLRVVEDERATFTTHILTTSYPPIAALHWGLFILRPPVFSRHTKLSLISPPVIGRYEAVANTPSLSVVWAIASLRSQ